MHKNNSVHFLLLKGGKLKTIHKMLKKSNNLDLRKSYLVNQNIHQRNQNGKILNYLGFRKMDLLE